MNKYSFINSELERIDDLSISDIQPFPLISVQNTNFPLLQPKQGILSLHDPKNKKRSIREITATAAAMEMSDCLTMEEELLYMIRIDPKDRPVWLWICSCIQHDKRTLGKVW